MIMLLKIDPEEMGRIIAEEQQQREAAAAKSQQNVDEDPAMQGVFEELRRRVEETKAKADEAQRELNEQLARLQRG